MKCPVCREVMIILELNQTEVDYCPSCYGLWLDGGELEILLSEKRYENKLFSSFTTVLDSKEKKLKCPVCRKIMEKVKAGENLEIIIDRCRNNHGLWFDFGELNLLADYAAEGQQNPLSALLNDVFKFKINQSKGG